MDGKQAVGPCSSSPTRRVVKPTPGQLLFIAMKATMSTDNGPMAWKEYQNEFPSSPLTENGRLLRFRRVRGSESTRYNWTQKHISWCMTNISERQPSNWGMIYKRFTEAWPKDPPTLKALRNFFANSVRPRTSKAKNGMMLLAKACEDAVQQDFVKPQYDHGKTAVQQQDAEEAEDEDAEDEDAEDAEDEDAEDAADTLGVHGAEGLFFYDDLELENLLKET
jgi:hypothetical protein